MNDFWANSGYNLLARTSDGRLRVTDDYLRRYLHLPELAPVAESCAHERALHAALLEQPRRTVSATDLQRIADPDSRENYGVMLRFRDRVLAHPTLESFYASLFASDIEVPPDFVHHTAQMIVRGLLEGEGNGLIARAAELFFREQRVSVDHGTVLAADAETVKLQASSAGLGNIGRLLREAQAPLKSVELEVLDDSNHERYWDRDERYDTVLPLNPGQPGAAALAAVVERWITHFHGIACTVTPVREIPDEEWRWHVGLDAEASALLNAVYGGEEVDSERMKRVIGLFRADFPQEAPLRSEVAGAPVFLALAMRPDAGVRLKPQNLLVNLPLARPA